MVIIFLFTVLIVIGSLTNLHDLDEESYQYLKIFFVSIQSFQHNIIDGTQYNQRSL